MSIFKKGKAIYFENIDVDGRIAVVPLMDAAEGVQHMIGRGPFPKSGQGDHAARSRLSLFMGISLYMGIFPINRDTIGAKLAYFVDFSSTSQNRKE